MIKAKTLLMLRKGQFECVPFLFFETVSKPLAESLEPTKPKGCDVVLVIFFSLLVSGPPREEDQR